jgi:hypothetical protein
MNVLVLDIETNLTHDTIWCCVAQWCMCTQDALTLGCRQLMQAVIDATDVVVGHNIIGFDGPSTYLKCMGCDRSPIE